MRPQEVFNRLQGIDVVGSGSWQARCDIDTEHVCWLLRSDGSRLVIETFPTRPDDTDNRPYAEMCIRFKSTRLFMRNAKGLLSENAFAAAYVKGSIRMTGDREKAEVLASVFKCVPPATAPSALAHCLHLGV